MLYEPSRRLTGRALYEEQELAHVLRTKYGNGVTRLMQLDTAAQSGDGGSAEWYLCILSGVPYGKTTTINMIIRYFEQEGMDIFLAAPTGSGQAHDRGDWI